MADACRGSFLGHGSRASRMNARQFLTRSGALPPSIDAVRKVHFAEQEIWNIGAVTIAITPV
jgi:hypothetical protein